MSEPTATVHGYTVGSEDVTFTAGAPADLVGTTATRWYVADAAGRQLISGLHTRQDAVAEAQRRHAAATPVTVALTNGATVTVPAGSAQRFAGLDAHGHLVYRDESDPSYLYPLTPCCQATGKGADSPTGVVCRRCYRTVDGYFGGPAEVAVAVAAHPEETR